MTEDAIDVWAYLQHNKAGLTKDSLELLAAGRKVADKLGQRVVAVILGYKVEELAEMAVQYGADDVLLVDSASFETYFNLEYADAVYSLIAERRPYAFLFSANEVGKDLAGRIAYRVPTGLATDTVQLEVEDWSNPVLGDFKNLMIQVRPDFGTRLAKILTPRHRPQMATVRPGSFAPLPIDLNRKGTIEKVEVPAGNYPARVTEVLELPPTLPDLAGADVIISLGLGILKDKSGRPRDPREAYQYAEKLKATIEARHHSRTEIGATRALIYAEVKALEGLIGKENQVGQTGTTVRPKVYFAIGISGALQHRVGMQNSSKIVAINTDPQAPIFRIAHYPIVGDLYEELPRLIGAIEGDRLAN